MVVVVVVMVVVVMVVAQLGGGGGVLKPKLCSNIVFHMLVCERYYVRVNGIMCALCAWAEATICALCAPNCPQYVRPDFDLLVCFL